MRAIQAGLPYRLGQALLTWCIYYSTYVLNLMPHRSENISPREIMTGLKPEFKRSLPIGFGEFAQVLERDPNNSLKPRTVTAIALLPTGKGPVKFASLSTGKTIVRETFKAMKHVPFEILSIVKAMQEKGMLGIEELLEPSIDRSDEEDELNILVGESKTSSSEREGVLDELKLNSSDQENLKSSDSGSEEVFELISSEQELISPEDEAKTSHEIPSNSKTTRSGKT